MIFALDIGTRVVVGVVLERGRSGWRIRASAVEEHAQRAMLDGQIHDVPVVTETIFRVKERLERRLRTPLKEVAVAAAGRALRTQRARATQRIGSARPVSREEVLALEIEAVHEALRLMARSEAAWNDYHCVGYSVVGYWLDGAGIGNLIGQRGGTAEVEVVATFLPRVVVDSLYSAVEGAGLSVQSLTLEPIAAGSLVISPAMRQLNLALVDIGAGTSDIALARDGALVAFGMVPVAGDEVTEYLCRELLLDFHEGERVKRLLRQGGEITFRDVVGTSHRRSAEEIIELIQPVAKEIAGTVAQAILEINGKAPQAIILVGGGSLTPGLAEALAGWLELPRQRVAVRGLEAVSQISGSIKGLEPAQAVTVLGIALASQHNQVLEFAQVQVNRRPVRLLKGGGATVGDALLAAGIGLRELYGSLGRGLTVVINGQLRLVRGKMGRPASITVNGRPAALDTPIGYGDAIEVGVPEAAEQPQVTVKDLLPDLETGTVFLNGRPVSIKPRVLMNGSEVDWEAVVPDNARIEYEEQVTVESLLARLQINLVPGERIMVNGRLAGPDWVVRDGDHLQIAGDGVETASPLEPRADTQAITVVFNGRTLLLPLPESGSPMVIDVLRYAEAETVPPPGKSMLVVKVNGQKANFTDPLQAGDEVLVGWE
ncbi:MAG: cell division protein FtsA [Moorellales bacterium]